MIYKTKEKINTQEAEKMEQDLNNILEQGQDVIIDFSNTKYIASAGFKPLLMGLKTFRAKGYDFSIVNVNDQVKEIFDITGLSDIFLLSDKDKSKLKK